jgi:SAM-dependent methyltransferase
MEYQCPLCHGSSFEYRKYTKKCYHECMVCRGIFLLPEFRPGSDLEKERYEQHNNDVNDPRYVAFSMPIIQSVLDDWGSEHSGLDFGAGTGPVITKVLREHGYQIEEYDPYFWNRPELLEDTYDFVVCCEVMEHFYFPDKSFELIYGLLKPQGRLYCMTEVFDGSRSFDSWFYKNDPTHVFFYRPETIQWIAANFQFQLVHLDNRLIVFEKA